MEKEIKETKKSESSSKFLFIVNLLLWTGLSVFISQFIIVLLLYFLLGKETLKTPVWTTVANALVYSFALFLIIFVPPFVSKKFSKSPLKSKSSKNRWASSRDSLGLRGLLTWVDIGLAPLGLLLSLLLASFALGLVSKLFPGFDLTEAQDVGYNFLNTGLDRTVAFFALCILAPIAEELIFRGFLYGKLRENLPEKSSLFLSIFLTSLLFGFLHGQLNVGITVFFMSVVLCGLREITGTIYSGILLHILKNTIAFIMVYIVGTGFLG